LDCKKEKRKEKERRGIEEREGEEIWG